RVLEGASDAAGNTGWARRSLAVLLAGGGTDFARSQEALKLLHLRVEADKVVETAKLPADELVEENRARARVLSAQGSRPFRAAAVAALEDLAKRQGLVPEDQFLLARLYETDGNWLRARDLLRELTATPRAQPGYLIHFARSLLRQRQTEEAARCLEQ